MRYNAYMPETKVSDAAIDELTLAIGLLVRKIRTKAPAESQDLSWTQRAVLVRLEKEGPTTTADLARAEGVKPQSMGTAIAALEELGLVERRPHATDGRQVHIALSAKGTAIRKTYRDAKRSWLAQGISTLSKQEQATLFAAGEIIKHLAEL